MKQKYVVASFHEDMTEQYWASGKGQKTTREFKRAKKFKTPADAYEAAEHQHRFARWRVVLRPQVDQSERVGERVFVHRFNQYGSLVEHQDRQWKVLLDDATTCWCDERAFQ